MRLARIGQNGELRGQSTAEYAIVFAVVLAAILGMQIFVKRGMNARLKDASDSSMDAVWTKLGKSGTPAATDLQYEPYYATSDYAVTQDTSHRDLVEAGGVVKKADVNEVTTRTGHQETGGAIPTTTGATQ